MSSIAGFLHRVGHGKLRHLGYILLRRIFVPIIYGDISYFEQAIYDKTHPNQLGTIGNLPDLKSFWLAQTHDQRQ
jgi:hypothetical protein